MWKGAEGKAPACPLQVDAECTFVDQVSLLTEERLEIQAIADDIGSKYVPP